MNRAAAKQRLFHTDDDYAAFLKVMDEAQKRVPLRLLTFTIMPNHWHMVVWPENDVALSEHMRWLSVTHAQRWRTAQGTSGSGAVYQGRFKSFPIQQDDHFYTVCRYVERNALRANLVSRAEMWRWCSLWHWQHDAAAVELSAWPLPRPAEWIAYVNEPQSEAEIEAIRQCVARSRPHGTSAWSQDAARALGLESTLRSRGNRGRI
jgi:putative transposase